MPCNTIQTSSVSLELKADNAQFFSAAMLSLGFKATTLSTFYRASDGLLATFADGQLRVAGAQSAVAIFNVNEVKRAYSVQVVNATAKKFGWAMQKKSDRQFVAQRRY